MKYSFITTCTSNVLFTSIKNFNNDDDDMVKLFIECLMYNMDFNIDECNLFIKKWNGLKFENGMVGLNGNGYNFLLYKNI